MKKEHILRLPTEDIMQLEMFSGLDEEISKEDWERTPASIQRLLRWLLESYEERLADLEEDKLVSTLEREHLSGTGSEKQLEAFAKEQELGCSFCGKKENEVAKIVAGPSVYICNECVDICNEIMEDEPSCSDST